MPRLAACNIKKKLARKVIPVILFGGLVISNFIVSDYIFFFDARVKDELARLRINLNVDFGLLNESKWVVPSFQSEPFLFEVETWSNSTPWRENTTYSVNYYDMGTTDWFKDNCTEWGEWGYSFHHLTGGAVDGAGVVHWGGYPFPPKNKREAYEYMQQYVINKTKTLYNNTRPWISFNGHYPYHHYAAEFGFDKIGSEIGENMESYQMLLAFNRGAARQYHLPWFVDVSAWYGAGITDYNNPPVWESYSGANNGHSLSLFRRSYYMSYMAGTSRLVAEGGSANFFYLHENVQSSGLMQLTPLGEVGREFAHFSRDHPDRGIPYTPVALYIDELHGTTGLGETTTFNSIPYTRGDWMTYSILETMFPGGWDAGRPETCQLVNNDFGDMFDIILQNASRDVLSSYPVVVMSGDLDLDNDEVLRLVEYVLGGGTLVVNAAYIDMLGPLLASQSPSIQLLFNKFDRIKLVPIENGNGGNIILYGPRYNGANIGPVLREIVARISPFSILTVDGGDVRVQRMVNRHAGGWLLTLINNDGITKTHHDPPVIVPELEKNIKIRLNDQFFEENLPSLSVARVEDWISNETVWTTAAGEFEGIDVSIEPGGLAVFNFV
nr:hypothetical protein [Candidatus Sigynarchaeota archaeon]